MSKQPGPLIRRWEAVPGPRQFLIVLAISAPIFFLMHNSLGTMSTALALGYGAGYGVVFALLAVWATKTELRKRHERDADQTPSE